MSAFEGPKNTKLQGGLGRRNPSKDNIEGMVMGGVAVADQIALGETKTLIQLQDAINLGLTAAYDAANNVQVYYHIAEFFRINPDGTLHIMLAVKGTSQTAMWDVENEFCLKLFNSHKDIKLMATVLNPADGYTPTVTNGIDADVEGAIAKAQAMVEALALDSLYLDTCLIEGRNVSGTIADMVDNTTRAASGVAFPVIGNDPAQVALNAEYANTAAMGLALGSLGVRKVNESMGSVEVANPPEGRRGQEAYSLTDVALGRVETAAISSGVDVATLSATDQKALTDKGYLFMGFFEGYDGFYWNADGTCVEKASDFSKIQNNRVWNKAARKARMALIPKIRSVVRTTAAGQLTSTVVGSWELRVKKEIDQMLKDEEISSYDFVIDPNQDVLAGDEIVTQLEVVPTGTADKIRNEIGFSNPFQQQ